MVPGVRIPDRCGPQLMANIAGIPEKSGKHSLIVDPDRNEVALLSPESR